LKGIRAALQPILRRGYRVLTSCGSLLERTFWEVAERTVPRRIARGPEDWHPKLPPLDLLVSTKRGLFVLSNGKLSILTNKPCYGATRTDGDRWYVFERVGKQGRIISFQYLGNSVTRHRIEVRGLSPGCHQLDLIGQELWLTDTYNNRILALSMLPESPVTSREFYPLGRLETGRRSPNYAHMNSVWADAKHVYVFCHNETAKTGRVSSIAKLDHNGKLVETISTPSGNGHNVLCLDHRLIYCGSMEGTLMVDHRPVFQCSEFTRGLAVYSGGYIVGGSQYGAREKRMSLRGSLHFLDHDFEHVETVSMPGMVQEVRVMSEPDRAMSGS